MSTTNIARLWSFLGPITFFYTLNCWIATTKSTPPFSLALPDTRPVIAAYLGCFVVSLLLTVVSLLGYKFAKRSKSEHWSLRVPVILLEDLNPQSYATKTYQSIFIFAFVVLPMLSILHFNNWVLSRADVHDKRVEQTHKKSPYYFPKDLSVLSGDLYKNEFCMGQDLKGDQPCKRTDKDAYDGGVTWFPLYSPILMQFFSIVGLFAAATFLVQLFKRSAA